MTKNDCNNPYLESKLSWSKTYIRLLSLLFKERPYSLLFYFALVIISGLIPALSILVLVVILESGGAVILGEQPLNILLMPVLIYSFLLILQYALNMITNILFQMYQRNLIASLDRIIFLKMEKVSMEQMEHSAFHDQVHRARSMVQSGRVMNDMRKAVYIIQVSVTILTIFGVIVNFSYWLILSLIVASLPVTILRLIRGKEFWKLQWFQSSRQRLLEYLSSILTSRNEAKELRAFHSTKYILHKWSRLRNELREERWKFEKKNLANEFFYSSATTEILAYSFSILIAILAAINGNLEISSFVATIIALRTFQENSRDLLVSLADTLVGARYVSDLFYFIDNAQEEPTKNLAFPKKLKNSITFNKVSFSYPGSESPALTDIICEIKANECIAVVGENGSGKTTFIKLLLGLYQPDKGEVLYDGIDLKDINDNSFRSAVSVVFQDYSKYQYTLLDNIIFGEINASQSKIRIDAAVTKSGIKDMVSNLENGLHTRLGKEFPGSTDISGGEWQRTAIARGLMRSPQVLVLDEPTASFDPIHEANIYKQFSSLSKDKTSVIVSHRLASCRFADRIFVFSNQMLVETGSHTELINKKGLYYTMYTEQSKWYIPQGS